MGGDGREGVTGKIIMGKLEDLSAFVSRGGNWGETCSKKAAINHRRAPVNVNPRSKKVTLV